MIADAIKDVSKRGDIVLDLFGGSGSTLIAAHKTGRRGYICELDPLYCDRIIRRWQTYAKDDAIFVKTGESFDFMESQLALGTETKLGEGLTQSSLTASNKGDDLALHPSRSGAETQLSSSHRHG